MSKGGGGGVQPEAKIVEVVLLSPLPRGGKQEGFFPLATYSNGSIATNSWVKVESIQCNVAFKCVHAESNISQELFIYLLPHFTAQLHLIWSLQNLQGTSAIGAPNPTSLHLEPLNVYNVHPAIKNKVRTLYLLTAQLHYIWSWQSL